MPCGMTYNFDIAFAGEDDGDGNASLDGAGKGVADINIREEIRVFDKDVILCAIDGEEIGIVNKAAMAELAVADDLDCKAGGGAHLETVSPAKQAFEAYGFSQATNARFPDLCFFVGLRVGSGFLPGIFKKGSEDLCGIWAIDADVGISPAVAAVADGGVIVGDIEAAGE